MPCIPLTVVPSRKVQHQHRQVKATTEHRTIRLVKFFLIIPVKRVVVERVRYGYQVCEGLPDLLVLIRGELGEADISTFCRVCHQHRLTT